VICSGDRIYVPLFVLAFVLHGCKSKHRRNEPENDLDVQVPVPADAQAGDAASPDAGKDCAARKHIKQGSPMHPPFGQIIPGDGIQSDCLGDPVGPEIIHSANGCEPRGEWRRCRLMRTDLYYDKNWRLDVIRTHRDARWSRHSHRTPRTPDGIGPGMSPDNVASSWGKPLRTEHVKDPDFGPVEIRYYRGIALEIERPPRGAPVVGGVYVFPMGRSPRLGALAPAAKDAGVK
jgi:hypothetical protein